MNSSLAEESAQNYSHLSFDEILSICLASLAKPLNTDIIHHIQSEERLAKDLTMKDFIVISKLAKILVQKSHLKAKLEQSKVVIPDDFCFTIAQNKSSLIKDTDQYHKRFYSTKKPYEYSLKKNKCSSPPQGYKPVCVQLLARHGSRTLNSHDYDVQTLKIWELAKQTNMLTQLGEQLKDDIELFMHENNRIGFV